MCGIISHLSYNTRDSQNESEEQPNFWDVTPYKVVTTERARRPGTLSGRRTSVRGEIELNAQSLTLPKKKKKNCCNTQGHVTEVAVSFTVFHVWDFLHFQHHTPPPLDRRTENLRSLCSYRSSEKNIYIDSCIRLRLNRRIFLESQRFWTLALR